MNRLYEGSMSFDLQSYDCAAEMWEDIKEMMTLLIKQEYVVMVRYEDCDIYVLEYGYDFNNKYGAPMPMWLEADEVEDVLLSREANEDND